MKIPDRWIADMQLLGENVRLELAAVAETPGAGERLETESYGTWAVVRVLRAATDLVGAAVEVQLVASADRLA